MGLSSLQGRLLMLVGRQSDVERQEMDISERQNELAWLQEEAALKYSEALNNTVLVMNVEKNSSDSFQYEQKVVDYKTLTSEGYLAVTVKNEILLEKDDNGNWIIPKTKDGDALIRIENGKAIILSDASKQAYDIKDGTKYLSDPKSIQLAFDNGALFLLDTQNLSAGKLSSISASTTSEMEWVLDTSDDAAAETEYHYQLAKLSRQDNGYDMDMKKLETEHEALSKEYEATTKAIDSNIERTFNLFGNG